MKTNALRKSKQGESWPRKVQPGRNIVTVYRRKTPSGNYSYMVSNYADGETRRFDSYATESNALDAADTLARRLDKRDFVASSFTREQSLEFANAAQKLLPLGISITDAVSRIVEALNLVGDLANMTEACKIYATRHKKIVPKRVADTVTELITVKESRGASAAYADDLRWRLTRFGGDFQKDIGSVTTSEIQTWLDTLQLSTQSYMNYRRVLNLLFTFAVARGYAVDNPVEKSERIKVRNGDIEIFRPAEMLRLLEAARVRYPDFLPVIAIGAFAGLRSAEIERLDWEDIDLNRRLITVAASKAKTASRRIVPIHDNLAEWLAPYAARQGRIWPHATISFHKRQSSIAAATAVKANEKTGVKEQAAVKWKINGLRHSYASYRFAQINDAGRVAGELGNSATIVHRHYRELVKPADAEKWFAIKPAGEAANVLPLSAAL